MIGQARDAVAIGRRRGARERIPTRSLGTEPEHVLVMRFLQEQVVDPVALRREVDQARRLDAVNALAAEAQELGIY